MYSGNKNIKDTFLIKQYFATYVAYSSSLKLKFLAKLHKSLIYKSHLVKKENLNYLQLGNYTKEH